MPQGHLSRRTCLKKENVGFLDASFLDLDISITNNKLSLKLYDKRDAFPFSIVRMPFLSNNMPSIIFYATIGGELLRITRCTTELPSFIYSCNQLLKIMYKQGAKAPSVRRTINKIYTKHSDAFHPFFNTSIELVCAIMWAD